MHQISKQYKLFISKMFTDENDFTEVILREQDMMTPSYDPIDKKGEGFKSITTPKFTQEQHIPMIEIVSSEEKVIAEEIQVSSQYINQNHEAKGSVHSHPAEVLVIEMKKVQDQQNINNDEKEKEIANYLEEKSSREQEKKQIKNKKLSPELKSVSVISQNQQLNLKQVQDTQLKQSIALSQQIADPAQKQIQIVNKNKKSLPEQQIEQQQINLGDHLSQQILRYQDLLKDASTKKDQKVLKKLIHNLSENLEKLKDKPIQQIDINPEDDSELGGLSLIKEVALIYLQKQMQKEKEEEDEVTKNLSVKRGKRSKQEIREKHLKEIYKFYCQIVYQQKQDFERINYERQILTEGKFMIFCRQFGILEQQNIRQHEGEFSNSILNDRILSDDIIGENEKLPKQIPFKELVTIFIKLQNRQNEIFKRHFQNAKEISLPQFAIILPILSERMFPKKQNSYEEFIEKILLIDTKQFRHKMKPLQIPFSTKDVQNSKDIDEKRKRQYQSQILDQKKLEISKWKALKQQQLFGELEERKQTLNILQSQLQQPQFRKARGYGQMAQKQINLRDQEKHLVRWDQQGIKEFNGFQRQEVLQLIEEQGDEEDQYYLREFDIRSNYQQKQTQSSDNKWKRYLTQSQFIRKEDLKNMIINYGIYDRSSVQVQSEQKKSNQYFKALIQLPEIRLPITTKNQLKGKNTFSSKLI